MRRLLIIISVIALITNINGNLKTKNIDVVGTTYKYINEKMAQMQQEHQKKAEEKNKQIEQEKQEESSNNNITSNEIASLIKLASNEQINIEELMNIATKCSEMTNNGNYANSLADAIISNPNVNNDIMYILSNSKHYTVINSVAKSDLSDENTLLNIANKCAKMSDNSWTKSISTSILSNPNLNSNIIDALSNSDNPFVLSNVANSSITTSTTLEKIAQKCINISDNRNWAETIATNIISNNNLNCEVLNILLNSDYYTILNKVASSSIANQDILMKLAIKCAKINDSESIVWAREIATNIAYHENATDAIINELSNSSDYRLLNIAVNSPHANVLTLKSIAIKCSKITDDSLLWAETIAKSIKSNKNVTIDILKEFSKSPIKEIANLAVSND